jgi:hypothetical protein
LVGIVSRCACFAGIRKTCLMVLSHLILNDMMKVKGHISRLALCLQDGDPRVAGLAQVFFHELSRKAFKVSPSRPLGHSPHISHPLRQLPMPACTASTLHTCTMSTSWGLVILHFNSSGCRSSTAAMGG